MTTISYEEFLKVFELMPYHSECEFCFFDIKETYMLIKYENSVSFQRCGYSDEMIKAGYNTNYRASGEIYYNNLEELYNSKSVDNICLRTFWEKIKVICVDSSFRLPNEIDGFYSIYRNKR